MNPTQYLVNAKSFKVAILAAALAASLPAVADLSSITSVPDLGGKSDPNGIVVWFNSVMRPVGAPLNQPVTVCVTQQVITVQYATETQTIEIPDAVLSFKPWETRASTSFGAPAWSTSIASAQSSRFMFMSGETEPYSFGLPRNTRNMTWTARFESDTPGISVQWQWGAAAYRQFSDDFNSLGVASGDRFSSDSAGTPVAFKAYVIGSESDGMRFTGARSAVGSAAAEVTGRCGGVF